MRECDNAPALQAWFDRLAGQWRVERRSSDGSSFTGDAVFARREDGSFQLEETGNLRLANGQSLPARRGWIWSFCPGNGEAGDAVEIRYSEEAGGGPYHRFQPGEEAGIWTGKAEHVCGQDVYYAVYRLGSDSFDIDHDVTGPAKDYRLFASYRRDSRAGYGKNG